jgi:hypothetical protein
MQKQTQKWMAWIKDLGDKATSRKRGIRWSGQQDRQGLSQDDH